MQLQCSYWESNIRYSWLSILCQDISHIWLLTSHVLVQFLLRSLFLFFFFLFTKCNTCFTNTITLFFIVYECIFFRLCYVFNLFESHNNFVRIYKRTQRFSFLFYLKEGWKGRWQMHNSNDEKYIILIKSKKYLYFYFFF